MFVQVLDNWTNIIYNYLHHLTKGKSIPWGWD